MSVSPRKAVRTCNTHVVHLHCAILTIIAVDKVKIHYIGRLTNGDTFDSSRERWVSTLEYNDRWVDRLSLFSSGFPFVTEIGVGKVIKGWDEGELVDVERDDLIGVFDLLIDKIRRATIVYRTNSPLDMYTRLCMFFIFFTALAPFSDCFSARSGVWWSRVPTRNTSQCHTHIRGGAPWHRLSDFWHSCTLMAAGSF